MAMVDVVITLVEQIAEVRREIALRERVYAKQVGAGTLKPEQAERQLAKMQAVLATVERVKRLDDVLAAAAEPRAVQ
jgi:3-hydroxyacyl-CoA dehydrogenase